jgi:serine/threonine protein kinase/WD40 repeat protein
MPDDAELFDFLDEYRRDMAVGRELGLAHYLQRYPGHEEAIACEFVRLREPATEPAPEPAPDSSDERRIGPYLLLRELGQGGQGAVWIAEDTRIARQVALKFMPSSFALLSAEKRRRFKREADVVSRLEHPSICPVFEAEIDHDPPYIAMRLVEGETLASAIARARSGVRSDSDVLPIPPRTPVELRRVLQFFERAARALHAAHEAGVVHRDFKPGNVMVTKSGEPVVLDFGQARDERANVDERTLSGEVLGTPAYMSPEQVEGSARGVDRRTDVWSLGASLFETLTLQRPFQGESVAALMFAIRSKTIPNPRTRSRIVDEDVAVVLETALEKDLRRRYPSALEFAEDLRRIREYEPIRARPAGPLLKARRWAQRHPALAFALAAIVAGIGWTVYLSQRERSALKREVEALKREGEAIDGALGRYLAVRALDVLPEDPSAALAIALKAVNLAPGYQARASLATALESCWLAGVFELGDSGQGTQGENLVDLDVSSDGQLILGATSKCRVCVWNLHSGERLSRFTAGTVDGAQLARFDMDARSIVTAGADCVVRIWDAKSGTKRFELESPGGPIAALALLPGLSRFAVLSRSGRGIVFDAANGSISASFEVEAGFFNELRATSDGRRLLVASSHPLPEDVRGSDDAVLVDALDGRVLATLEGQGSSITSSDVSRDGTLAVTASLDGLLRVWYLPEGVPEGEPLDEGAPLSSVRFARDGQHLFTGTDAGRDSRVSLWDLRARTRRTLESPHADRIQSIEVSERDGDIVVSSRDPALSVWSESGELRNFVRELVRPVRAVWTPDGTRIVTLALATYGHVWWGENRPDTYRLAGHGAAVRSVAFSSDGRRAVTTSNDGTARLWHTPRAPKERAGLEPGREIARAGGTDRPVTCAGFGSHGEPFIAFADGQIGVLCGASDELLDEHCVEGQPIDLRFSDPREPIARMAVLTSDGNAFVRELHCTASQFRLVANGATCVRFVRGDLLATGSADGRVGVFDVSTGELVSSHECKPATASADGAGLDPAVVDIAVRCDGEELAVASLDRRVRFFTPLAEEPPRKDFVAFPPRLVAYDASGTLLLVVGTTGKGAMRTLDLDGGRRIREQIFHTADLTGGSFDRSGRLTLTCSRDGSVYVRESATGEPVARRLDLPAPVTCAVFSTDDGEPRILAGCEDGSAFVWPVDPTSAARARKPRELNPQEEGRERRLAEPLPYR